MQLADKVAVVTGASRGVGAAIAEALGRHGATVVLVARTQEGLARTAERVTAAGGRALALPADVTSRTQLEALVPRITADVGPIDILVNNAGIEGIGALVDFELDEIEAIWMTNVASLQILTRLVVPQMINRRSGHIVNIGSTAGWGAGARLSPYVSSKYAVRGFSFCLRNELRPHGIAVSLVSPTWVEDDGFVKQWGLSRRTPWYMGSVTTAEVADAVLSLLASGRRERKVMPLRMKISPVVAAISPGFMDWFVRFIGLDSYAEAASAHIRKRKPVA